MNDEVTKQIIKEVIGNYKTRTRHGKLVICLDKEKNLDRNFTYDDLVEYIVATIRITEEKLK